MHGLDPAGGGQESYPVPLVIFGSIIALSSLGVSLVACQCYRNPKRNDDCSSDNDPEQQLDSAVDQLRCSTSEKRIETPHFNTPCRYGGESMRSNRKPSKAPKGYYSLPQFPQQGHDDNFIHRLNNVDSDEDDTMYETDRLNNNHELSVDINTRPFTGVIPCPRHQADQCSRHQQHYGGGQRGQGGGGCSSNTIGNGEVVISDVTLRTADLITSGEQTQFLYIDDEDSEIFV